MHFNAKIISDLNQLLQLEADWRRLSQRTEENTGFFCGWEFVSALLETTAPAGWRVLVFYPEDNASEAAAIFPLELFNVKMGEGDGQILRMARPLGLRYAPYVDFPVLPAYRSQVWQLLRGVLRDHCGCDAFLLGAHHQDSPNIRHLRQCLAPEQVSIVQCPDMRFIDARGRRFDDFFTGKKRELLLTMRRCERRLRELGELRFESGFDTDESKQWLHQLLQWQSNQFGGDHYYGPSEGWWPLFEQLAERQCHSGAVEFSSLCLNGELIAAHLGFHDHGRRYYYMPAYAKAFSRYSPSKILLSRLIELTFEQGEVFCFGAGDYDYKRVWSEGRVELSVFCIFLAPRARTALAPFMTIEQIGKLFM